MKRKRFILASVVLVVFTSLIISCKSSVEDEHSTPKLNDAQIASIALTADKIDVSYAKIALQKTTNPKVKAFAKNMAHDHQEIVDKATALAKKLGVTPQDNATTQALLDGAKKVKAHFDTLTGANFDTVYINNEVSYHKAAIDIVENVLIPDCTNAELKSLLQSALPLFKKHLEHAIMIQKQVGSM